MSRGWRRLVETRQSHRLGDRYSLSPGWLGLPGCDRMNPFERLRTVITASTLITYADQDLFENHEAGFMLEGFAINSLALYNTFAEFTAISELLLHGYVSVTLYTVMIR